MLLSIIIPVYNVEKYIDKCIQSVVNQTYSNIEIILVDDGSTDSSGELCDLWQKQDERVSVIHKYNGGLSSARNAGLEVAKGDLIGFIDSDDFVESDMYETMISALIHTGKDIACCGRIVDVWSEYEKKEFVIHRETVFDREESIRQILLLTAVDVAAWDKIYKSALFKSIRYPEGKICEDASIIFDLVNRSNGIVHVAKPFYHYIFRSGSISKTSYNHAKYDMYRNLIHTHKLIYCNYPNLKRECNIYCCQMSLNLLQSMYEDRESLRKFPTDYIKYRALFEKGFIFLLAERDLSLKVKIKSIFMFTHCFTFFLFLNNIRKKTKFRKG